MRKLFIIALLLFIITTCIGCSDNPSTNVAAYEPITNEVYTQIQDVEEVQPTIVYITATGKKYKIIKFQDMCLEFYSYKFESPQYTLGTLCERTNL